MYVVRTNIWIYFLNIVVAIFQKILESKDYILRLQHEYIHQFILDVLRIYLDLISYSCCNFPNLTKRDLTTSSGNRCFSTKNASYVMFVKKIRGRYVRQTYIYPQGHLRKMISWAITDLIYDPLEFLPKMKN